jgi:hypothetical protein
MDNDSPPLKRGAGGDLVVVGSLSHFQIPLNPPFLKGEISHNDLNRTTIKAAKIYKTGGLEIRIHSESVNKKMKDAQYTIFSSSASGDSNKA